MNAIAERLENLTQMLRAVLEKQKIPKERNLVKFEQQKNAIIRRKPDPVTDPKAYDLWKNEILTENRRSHTLPFAKSREYLHAAIFGGDPDLHDAAVDNTHLTTREEAMLKALPVHKDRWKGPESAQVTHKAMRAEGDRCMARHRAVLYKADADTYFSNHAHSAPLWKQMTTLYSQPNNLHALDDLLPATADDAEPVPFKKLREHRQSRAKLPENIQSDMRKQAIAGLKALKARKKDPA
jgi:hypothetical protein